MSLSLSLRVSLRLLYCNSIRRPLNYYDKHWDGDNVPYCVWVCFQLTFLTFSSKYSCSGLGMFLHIKSCHKKIMGPRRESDHCEASSSDSIYRLAWIRADLWSQMWNRAVRIATLPIVRNTQSEKIRSLLDERILLSRFPIIVSTAVAAMRAMTAPTKTRRVF